MQRFRGIGLRAVSFNTLFQFLVRVIGSGTSLIVTLIIAAHMGYPTIGSFIKVTEYISIFYLLIDFGLNPVFQKLHVNDIDKSLGNLAMTRLLLVVVLLPIIVLSTFLLPETGVEGAGFSTIEKHAIIVFAFTLFSSSLNMTWQAILQQKLGNKLTIPTSLLSSLAVLGVVFYASKTGNFYFLFVAFIISGSLYCITTYLLIRKKYFVRLAVHNLFPFAKRLLLNAWPLGVIIFINFLYVKADIFLLSIYKQNIDVGIYGIAYRFFDVAVAVPTFLASSTYPLLLSVMSDHKKYVLRLKKYLMFYALVSIVGTVLVVTFSPIIQILRDEFFLSVAPLQILALSLPFFFMTSLLQWHFLIKGKVLFLIPMYVGVFCLNIVLNIIFIPLYSYHASAVITGLCEGIVFVILLWYFVYTSNDSKSPQRKN